VGVWSGTPAPSATITVVVLRPVDPRARGAVRAVTVRFEPGRYAGRAGESLEPREGDNSICIECLDAGERDIDRRSSGVDRVATPPTGRANAATSGVSGRLLIGSSATRSIAVRSKALDRGDGARRSFARRGSRRWPVDVATPWRTRGWRACTR